MAVIAYGILFKNNNLHFEIQIDQDHPIGSTDQAGIKDILWNLLLLQFKIVKILLQPLMGGQTTVYRNWLGLMKGNLTETFSKNGSK